MTISKQSAVKIVLGLWLVGASIYVLRDLWLDYAERGVQSAYQAGTKDAIAKLVKQAEESNCKPFFAYNSEKQVQLLNVDCLKEKQQEQQKEAKETPKK